ncbi:MAG: hypothetical protein C4527_03680 [Candidatus Omnitrophota bacterium]|nr:MAG: hypothetical protein C4527_03680 [Candidatus Omnitrophota bacterium]
MRHVVSVIVQNGFAGEGVDRGQRFFGAGMHGVTAIADSGFVRLVVLVFAVNIVAVHAAGRHAEQVFHAQRDAAGHVAFQFGDGNQHIRIAVGAIHFPRVRDVASARRFHQRVVFMAAEIARIFECDLAVHFL